MKKYFIIICCIILLTGCENKKNNIISDKETKVNVTDNYGENIEISYPIINSEKINLVSAGELSKQGYDIYDPKDSFYSDKCSSFSNGTVDVTIADRRKDIYQEIDFCQAGCVYQGVNYTTNKVSCNCTINNEIKESKQFDEFGKSLFEQTNLILFTCYNHLMQVKEYRILLLFFYSNNTSYINRYYNKKSI